MSKRNQIIVVLGASGFIGQNVFKTLARCDAYNVIPVSSAQMYSFNLERQHGILESFLNLSSAEIVINCASVFSRRSEAEKCARWVRERGFYSNIIRAVTSLEMPCKFIGLNSMLIREASESLVSLDYRRACTEKHQLFKNAPWQSDYYELFLPNIFGENDVAGRLLPLLIHNLSKNIPTLIENPEHLKTYLYVDDLADLLCIFAGGYLVSGSYRVDGYESVSVAQLAREVTALMRLSASEAKELLLFNKSPAVQTHQEMPSGIKNIPKDLWIPSTPIRHGLEVILRRSYGV